MSGSRNPAEVLCADCGQIKQHDARRLCFDCYDRNATRGTLDQYPLLSTWLSTLGRVEDYAELRYGQYLSIGDAAARLGVHRRTAERYEAKLKAGQAVTPC